MSFIPQPSSFSLRANPFPGLRPFRSDEHHLFFGREVQTAALLQLLRTNRFLAVVGTSGSGKSSLVRAGLIAELYGGTMTQAGSTWEVIILRPGGSPIENLARAMVEADLYDAADASTLPRLLATLSRSRFGLVEAMKQSTVLQPGTNVLVVVDQFEELFRFRQQDIDSEEAATSFVNLLLTASEQTECPIYVTLTMRSDYLGDCSEIPGLAEAVNEGEYLIPRLQRDQKRDAIEMPIGVGGAKISPLLVQRLLNDVGDDPDQLPVLQHALMRMWDVWSAGSDHSRPIEFSDFEATGGLAAALSNHADEIYDSLPDEMHRHACARIFKTLTVKGDDNRGIRRPTRLSQLQAIAGADRATITTVLAAYRRAGVTFVMPGMEVELGDRTVLDLSHESLMRGWQRLRSWVEDEAQSARIFRRLADTASLWRDGKAGLFRDPDLQIGLSWREQEQSNAEWAEQYAGQFDAAISFLDTSNADAEAEQQAREATRQRELDQAKQLAEAQQLRLDQQQRAARKLQKLIGGLAVVAIVAVCACVAALVANRRANDLALVAEQKSEIAEASAADADRERTNAEQALTQVESQKAAVENSLTKAEAAEQDARAAEEAGRKLLYTTDMQLAPFVWRDDRATAEQLRVLLAKHVPEERMPEERLKDEGGKMKTEQASDSSFILPPSSFVKPDLRGFEWHYYQHLLESSSGFFAEHSASIEGGALTSDGQLVTLDLNAHVRHWDLESQQEDQAGRRDLPGGPVAQVRILSPNGRLAALAEDNTVHVFEISSGNEIFQFYSANSLLRRLIFSRENDRLVVVDDKIRWYSALTGEVLASLDRKFDRIETLALSGDGLTLAVVGYGSLGQMFSIYRLDATQKTVTQVTTDAGVGGTLHASALSPDGQSISIGERLSGGLRVFETASGRQIAVHRSAHASPVAVIAYSSDGSKLATADTEGTIKIWADVEKLNSKSAALLTLKGHQGAVNAIGFSDDGKQLMTTSVDKTARVWDLENSGAAIQPLERTGANTFNTLVTRFSPDGQLIAVANSGSSSVGLWDAATGKLLRELSASDKGRVYSFAFSPTDNRLLAVGYGGQADVSYVALWDIDAGTEFARLPGATDLPDFQVDDNNGAVGALAFSPDGKHLVAGFGSKNLLTTAFFPVPLKIWEVATRRLIRRLNGHMNYCMSIEFSRDGTKLASGSRDGTAMLWSTDTWKVTHTLQNPDQDDANASMVESVAFSPDGKLLAVASRGGTVQLWDAASGKLVESLNGHSSAVSAVVFSPDGRTLASSSSDQTVRLWNIETRRQLMQLDSGTVALGTVVSLAYSPDGTRLMAGGDETAFWSTVPNDWNDPDRAADKLKLLLQSSADFQSRIRMFSENLRLHAALEKLDVNDVRVAAALAAMQANWYASRQAWPEAVAAYDRLLAADLVAPDGWLRTPGLLRLATALLHQDRSAVAAAVLQAGSNRAGQDPGNASAVGFGVEFTAQDGRVFMKNLIPGSPAARSNLLPGDAILQVNGVDTANLILADVSRMLDGEVGTKSRLTVRHPGSTESEDIDLVKSSYLSDGLTAELLSTLQAMLEERLGTAPHNVELLELRAELAGLGLDFTSQVADYTAVIEALNGQTTEGAVQNLQRLYGRRGNAHVALRQWPLAVEDYARSVTDATTDEALLSNQALALAQSNIIEMKPPEHFGLFGKANESNGIHLLDSVGDGLTEPATVDGQECRMAQTNAEGSNGVSYIYFAVDESFKRTPVMNVRVEIEYKASGSGNLQFQYDSPNSPYATSPETVLLEKSTEWKTASFTLKDARLANSQNGQADFRFLLLNTGRFYFRRISARQVFRGEESRDPWVQLAGVYRIKNALEAIDKLVERHPGSTAAVGDLFAAEQEWQRAIEIYSRAITAETTDIDLLSKRALAWEGIQNWEAAAADWSRAARGTPDEARLLAEFARRLALSNQFPLANSHFEKSRALYEKSLLADPENEQLATELAQVLLDQHEKSSAAFEQQENRLAARNVKDAWLQLAAAYALNDRNDAALEIYSRAFLRAEGYEARKPILDVAVRFDDVMSALVHQHPDDPQLQLAVARNLTARAKTALAVEWPAEALASLKQAHNIYHKLLPSVADWTVLTPIEMTTENGAKLELQKDSSIFVHQPPSNDIYTLVFETELKGITGLRLEALADSRLPHGGSGWDAAGDFLLSELTLQVAPAGITQQPRFIALKNASSDFFGPGWNVQGVIDNSLTTGWSVSSENNKDHTALFELAAEAGDGLPNRLTVRLKHRNDFPKALLGRFRLSWTDDAATLKTTRIQLDLKDSEVVDVGIALAKAQARQGFIEEAMDSFRETLDRATVSADKVNVVSAVASMAVSGQSNEKSPLDDMAKAAFIRQALNWLKTELVALSALIESGMPNDQLRVVQTLARWRQHAELSRLRDPESLVRLAEAEQQEWLAFWADVDAAFARAELLAQQAYKRLLDAEPENITTATELADLLLTDTTRWSVLKPIEMTSPGVETFTVENDGSIFVSGLNPDRALYTLKLRTELPTLTAIRLDTIPDARLPEGGAGRFASNGNFHVAEFSAAIESGQANVEPIPMDFYSAITDFEGYPQSPLEIIDGNPLTFWDTIGKVKEAHSAVFGLKSPVRIDGGTVSITLDSGISSWGKHGLGRFRLSVSDDPTAFERRQRRISVLKLTDPWQRLAAAYFVVGDQPALDKLVEQHPEVVAGIGDLYAMIEDWDRAIAEYNKLITPETRDATLLAKRAAANETLQKWDLAVADWARASQQQPDVAFKHLKSDSAPSWQLDQHHGAACSMTAIDETMVFKTTVATGTNWHVQAYQGQLQLENGVEYVIRFKMKSTDSCTVTLFGAINQEDWHGIGLNETFVPPTDFKDYEFTFIPVNTIPGNNRIGFHLGTNQGEVIVKEIVILTKRDGVALHEAGSLAKRAADDVSSQNWDRAQAEWRQAVAQQPKLMQIAFDQFRNARRWSEAAEFGLKLVEQKPDDTMVWLQIAPVLALAEDPAVYSEFCGRMAQQFAESKLPETAERVTKASLLRANTIDIAKFHGEIFAKLLDEGTVPDSFLPWGWGTRALLAYRGGDAESAVKYVAKSEEYKPIELAHAMNLVVRAMAQHQLGQADEAGRTLEEASQLVIRLKADPGSSNDFNLLIAEILFHEAEALMNGNEQPKGSGSEEK